MIEVTWTQLAMLVMIVFGGGLVTELWLASLKAQERVGRAAGPERMEESAAIAAAVDWATGYGCICICSACRLIRTSREAGGAGRTGEHARPDSAARARNL